MCMANLWLNWGSIPATLVKRKLSGKLSLYTLSGGFGFKHEGEERNVGLFACFALLGWSIEFPLFVEGTVCCLSTLGTFTLVRFSTWGLLPLLALSFEWVFDLSLSCDTLVLVLDAGEPFLLFIFGWSVVLCRLTIGVECETQPSSLTELAWPKNRHR